MTSTVPGTLASPGTAAASGTPLAPASAIICSRNRPQLLFESVQSVLDGEEVPAELIVMDQSDAPNTSLAALGTVHGCEVRYVCTRTVGECPARNEGIALARHDLLVFTDDDVRVEPTWYGTLVRALVDAGRRSVVTGRILPGISEARGGFVPTLQESTMPAAYTGRVGKNVLLPLNMALYRTAIEAAGGFDERLGAGSPYSGGEDSDLGYRLLEAGYRIVYVPEAVVYHRAWRGDAERDRLRWAYGRGQGAFYAKYLHLRDPYMLRRLAKEVALRAYDAACQARQHPRAAREQLITILGVLSGVGQWLVTQRLLAKTR